jgi:hypothetical protein
MARARHYEGWYRFDDEAPQLKGINHTGFYFVSTTAKFRGRPGYIMHTGTKASGRLEIDTTVPELWIPLEHAKAYEKCARDGGPIFDDNMELTTLARLTAIEDWDDLEEYTDRHVPEDTGAEEVGSW